MANEKKADDKAPAKPAKKSKKGLVLGLVGVVLLAGGAVAATTMMGGDPSSPPAERAEGDIVALESFVVNLADREAVRFARVGLAAVYAKGVNAEAAKARLPLVRNAMLRVFVPKTSRDLTELDALDRLHEELTEAARSVYPDGGLLRIVVTDVVVQ